MTRNFLQLHEDQAGFVMPNGWDAGTAILLAEAGFAAIGTTSAGIAHSLGRADLVVPDGAPAVSRSEMLDRVQQITAAVDIPVNADLEGGYGDRPEDVAETIRLAIDAGLAGANIEDHGRGARYDEELAVDRIVAAREAAGAGFVLTARTDCAFLPPIAPLADAIGRLNRFREAGADCLYAPTWTNDRATVTTLVREAGGPINVVLTAKDTVAELRAAGVTRISIGGGIARGALAFVRDVARELYERGTLTHDGAPLVQLDFNAIVQASLI
jgi:2-methylisocitrate lyase-like PEP mutase family enzyme